MMKRSNVQLNLRSPIGQPGLGLATASLFDDEPEASGPILGIDPRECDGKHPRTWDGCCHGCGIRTIPHP
jgi:hypothetical protein